MPVKVRDEEWSRVYLALCVLWPICVGLAMAWAAS